MQTYAEQVSEEAVVGFNEWSQGLELTRQIGWIHDWKKWRIWQHCPFYNPDNDLLTTAQLYAIYQQETHSLGISSNT